MFCMFGVKWVMPRMVVESLHCLRGQLGRYCCGEMWKVIPLYLMWCLWRERNVHTFEGC